MGEIREYRPVLRVMAVSGRHDEAFEWAREKAAAHWGAIALESPCFDFSETGYYTRTMGSDLKKQLLGFADLIPQDEVVESKLQSNAWEDEFRKSNDWEEIRPINLDPGYITEAKLVLATTKDRDHRIYLSSGIFAEITLFYQGNRWQSSRWTYPDYKRTDFHEFFDQCRNWLRDRYAAMASEQEKPGQHSNK
jgi:hypothetical protein